VPPYQQLAVPIAIESIIAICCNTLQHTATHCNYLQLAVYKVGDASHLPSIYPLYIQPTADFIYTHSASLSAVGCTNCNQIYHCNRLHLISLAIRNTQHTATHCNTPQLMSLAISSSFKPTFNKNALEMIRVRE